MLYRRLALLLFLLACTREKPADTGKVAGSEDVLPPSVVFSQPAEGATLGALVDLEATATDDVAVVGVDFLIDELVVATATGEPWRAQWDASATFNGNYRMSAVARDAAGNEGAASIEVTLDHDGAPPSSSLRLTNPVDGATICGVVTLEAVADFDLPEMVFSVDGVDVGDDASAPYTWSLDTTGLENGTHTLRASGAAPAGGGVQRTITVDVQNTGAPCDNRPSVAFTAPEDGGSGTGSISLAAAASDDLGVLGVQFFVDSGVLTEDTSVPFGVDWDTSPFAEGPYTLKAVARDTAGQTSEHRITFTVDRTAPSVRFAAPGDGDAIAGTAVVSAEASDSIALESVTLIAGGVELATLTEAPYTWEWDSTSASWGENELLVIARDQAGNTAQDRVAVTVDNPPTLRFSTPTEGTVVDGRVAVALEAVDDQRVALVEAWVDGVSLGVAERSPYVFPWDTCELGPSTHTLSAEATDEAGTVVASEIEVTVDQPLSIELEVAGAEPDSPVQAFVVDDDGDVSVVFDLDGVVLTTVSDPAGEGGVRAGDCATSVYSAGSWGELGVSAGTYTLTAAATNGVGDLATDSVVVTLVTDTDADGFDGEAWGGPDCDDADGAVYPGAPETTGGACDGKDSDCDGLVDEDYDLDGDGAYSLATCASGPYDCDDTDPAAFEGASETCGDGVDQDCSTDPVCGGTGSLSVTGATAKFSGEASTNYFGWQLAAGDVNSDGWPDLIATSLRNDDGGHDAGAAYIFYGPGLSSRSASAADVQFVGEAEDDSLSSVDVGDVDGDGVLDLVLGADAESSVGLGAGAVYLILGPATAGGSVASGDAKLTGDNNGDSLGDEVRVADLDGDGFDDIVSGAYGDDTASSGAGAAWVLYGPVTGEVSVDDADGTLLGQASGDNAGRYLATGDLDGDGSADLLVGAYYEDSGGSAAGAVYVVRTAPIGVASLSSADAKLIGEQAGDEAGGSLATGDLDDDGLADVIIGARGNDYAASNAGAAYVHFSSTGTIDLGSADVRVRGASAGDYAGGAVAAMDWDGDGVEDLVLGAYEQDSGASDAGAAYVLFGPLSGSLSVSSADVVVTGESTDDSVGYEVIGADLDLNGFDDLLMYAPYDDDGGTDAGAVYVIQGGPGE